MEKLNCHNLFLFEGNGAENKNFEISPEMARLLTCSYFFTSAEESILDTECAKYYTVELQTDVEDLERKKVPPLSKALLDGESCARDIMGQVSKNPSQESVFETIDYCFGRHKNIANRLKSAFEEIEPKKYISKTILRRFFFSDSFAILKRKTSTLNHSINLNK